jgi:hypothetical protein
VEATLKLIQDPVVTEYVNRLRQNIVRDSDAQVPFIIKVIDSEEIDAFAFEYGSSFFPFPEYCGIFTRRILQLRFDYMAADEEAELAGVMEA